MKKVISALFAGAVMADQATLGRQGHSVELWGLNLESVTADGWGGNLNLTIDVFMGWTMDMTVGVWSATNAATVMIWTPTILMQIGGIQSIGFTTPAISLGVQADLQLAKIALPIEIQLDIASFSGFAMAISWGYDIAKVDTFLDYGYNQCWWSILQGAIENNWDNLGSNCSWSAITFQQALYSWSVASIDSSFAWSASNAIFNI